MHERASLIKDVYKLGRAGDLKKVADGYGRNFLIPQGLAVLATPGALSRSENIREQANTRRAVMNNELSGVADILSKLTLVFPAKAGETGKLYGSITPAMIDDAIKAKTGIEINRRQMDFEPIRALGDHAIRVRLTIDLVPEIKVIVYREGEAFSLEKPIEEAEPVAASEPEETVSVAKPEAVEIEPVTELEAVDTKPETEADQSEAEAA